LIIGLYKELKKLNTKIPNDASFKNANKLNRHYCKSFSPWVPSWLAAERWNYDSLHIAWENVETF
jgi:hypothetical protein